MNSMLHAPCFSHWSLVYAVCVCWMNEWVWPFGIHLTVALLCAFRFQEHLRAAANLKTMSLDFGDRNGKMSWNVCVMDEIIGLVNGKDGHCIYYGNVRVIIKRRITIPFNPRQSTRALFLWLQHDGCVLSELSLLRNLRS